MISLGNILRDLFFMLDSAVYGLISTIYSLFYVLSETTIFDADTIKGFASRIYVLISLIMAFKLAFSFITYIVSPDSISDKQKGGTKLLTNIVITVALLASVPALFDEAYYLQGIIMRRNIIPKLILGSTTTNEVEDSKARDKASKELAKYAFFAFVNPSTRIMACSSANSITPDPGCITFLNDHSTSKILGYDYERALSGDLNYIFQSEDRNSTYLAEGGLDEGYSKKTVYLLDYQWGISTIAGLFLCWMLLGFCFDVAIRSVKLGFLQLIAPIPIIMNLTPGKKNGGMLSSWGKECLSTWASLFIRIAVISFSLYFIGLIGKGGGIFSFIRGGEKNSNLFVSVFIMFGILLFAKEFPKLLEDLFGIKSSGKLTLNPLKKLKEVPGTTMLAAGAAGLIGGGIGGMLRGAWAGKGAKTFGEGLNKAGTAVRNHRLANESGSDFIGRSRARFSQFTGRESEIERMDRLNRDREESIKGVKQTINNREKYVKLISDQEEAAIKGIKTGKGGGYTHNYNKEVADISRLEAELQSATTTADRNKISNDLQNARNNLEKNLSQWGRNLIDDIQSGVVGGYDTGLSDSIKATTNEINSAANTYGFAFDGDPNKRHAQVGAFNVDNVTDRSRIMDTEYEIEMDKNSEVRRIAKANQDAINKK